MPETRVTLHAVTSLDGFIASRDNSVAWLEAETPVYETGVLLSEEEMASFMRSVDCYVIGARTYEFALQVGWPYGETPVVVLTHRDLPCTRNTVEFYSGDLKRLLRETLGARFRNIWLAGGAAVCQAALELEVVDEIRVTVAPVLLGGGLRLFGGLPAEQRWALNNVVGYRNGFAELSYTRA
jgi:dihydrofolate reductase